MGVKGLHVAVQSQLASCNKCAVDCSCARVIDGAQKRKQLLDRGTEKFSSLRL